jgi:hypothetical protein
MSGFIAFLDRYRDEAACIAALAQWRWPSGFVCVGCAGRAAYQLASRPRVFECAGCGRQHSVTAGTVFHRTRTPLRKWFAAAWLLGQDKRGVSALFLSRELALRYDTAWLMAHKLRHVLSERSEYRLDGLIEIDESYYGGRGKPQSRGRGLSDPNKSLMAIAVEAVPASPRRRGHQAEPLRCRQRPHRRPALRHRSGFGRRCPRRRQARRPHHHRWSEKL